MERQSHSLTSKDVIKKVEKAIENNKEANIFHKTFLKPIEIALKDRKTQDIKTMDIDSLAIGLKQVIKKDISQNQYILKDFDSFQNIAPQNRNYRYLVDHNYDNMISLMKHNKKRQQIELAICICMYSQDKTMLRKTLAGVANNIATFVRNGISADQIVVCVVMDGIEKVDSSVVTFFQEMEKESNIYLDNEIDPMDVEEIQKSQIDDLQDEEQWNLNNFIFDEIELLDHKKRRFYQRKREYDEVKGMLKRIEMLEKNPRITFYDLDQFLKPFFFDYARQSLLKVRKMDKIAIDQMTNDDLIVEFGDNIKVGRPIIINALNEAKNYCNKYIATRDNLALLNSFRVDVKYGSFTEGRKHTNYEHLNEQQLQEPSVAMNLFLLTKYKNMGKLSSHNWFFNGFCKQVPSKYAVLLDVGLTPSKNALFKMYKFMDNDPYCGGVCGYMKLRMEALDMQENKMNEDADCLSRFCMNFVDIQRAQQVEYHFGHIIDKSFESFFNFIHVLPGAFSAYRMEALGLSSQASGSSELMKQYFKSLDDSTSDIRRKAVKISPCQAFLRVVLPDFITNRCLKIDEFSDERLLYDSNVYLAEDRTLCMGIHENGYKLQYLPDASGWVDPIKTLPGLLGQRKRWINGSFFAFDKVRRSLSIKGCSDILLQIQILYLSFMNAFAFVAPAFFLFTIHIAMFAFRDWAWRALQLSTQDSVGFQTIQFYNAFVYVIDFIYVAMMLSLILYSMHFSHRNPRFVPYIYGFATTFGILAVIVFVVLLYDMISGLIDGQTFLLSDPDFKESFFNALPGGEITFYIYKYLVVAVLASYAIPIFIFALFFHRFAFAFEILCGSLSFLFYTPTYLNILNTFALCRIDDISWGTKGLDSSTGGRTKELVDTWKTVKIIYIAKYIFWNVVVGVALLVLSSPILLSAQDAALHYETEKVNSYIRKFFITFGIMAIIFITMMFKIILGFCYSIKYRCCKKSIKIHKSEKRANHDSRISNYFGEIKDSVYLQIRENIRELMHDLRENDVISGKLIGMNSIIMFAKNLNKGKPNRRTVEKWNESYRLKSKSNFEKKAKKEEKSESIVENIPVKNREKNEIIYSSDSAKNLRTDSDVVETDKNKEKKNRLTFWN